jgi:hypothetical protein
MGTSKHTTAGRNGAAGSKAAPKRSGRATLKTRLERFVKREEARGAYRDFPDPTEAVAELRSRAKKPRHALRAAAA